MQNQTGGVSLAEGGLSVQDHFDEPRAVTLVYSRFFKKCRYYSAIFHKICTMMSGNPSNKAALQRPILNARKVLPNDVVNERIQEFLPCIRQIIGNKVKKTLFEHLFTFFMAHGA
ncbi:hypothetical protein L596_000692 [Steinernema carpocapsae]|uniref:Uncharacterized protein n=1 Tax=Steinernema carpocapsae TaxID=34508 RepID=A0A4U8UN25_STECR|nr:hypothetical protein L596_000692 [Steinernema carpocapsae]